MTNKNEFNLSEKRITKTPQLVKYKDYFVFYPEKDVKEFIKRLKEELNLYEKRSEQYWIAIETIIEKIDKLAGDKLI